MSTATEMREKQLLVRMNAEEWARAEAVAEHYGVSAANVVRMLFKEKARELGIDAAATTAKKPKAKR